MKKYIFLLAVMTSYLFPFAQNVGVGTSTPAEKLDVNGNINLTGQLKTNSNAGTANQVLMKDASNNLIWGDINEYKNQIIFDCTGIANTIGASNCSAGWTVPTGVTKIIVECWGGGGGGSNLTGGSGGSYISAKLNVTEGAIASLTIGAGGNYSSTAPIPGGSTTCAIGVATLQANGGAAGIPGDPFFTLTSGQAAGGGFSVLGISSNYIGYNGNPGGISKLSFMVAGAADYAKIVNYGDGGDAALVPGSGGKGGYRVASASVVQNIYATQYGIQQGGGGGADPSGGFYGRGGRIVIHW